MYNAELAKGIGMSRSVFSLLLGLVWIALLPRVAVAEQAYFVSIASFRHLDDAYTSLEAAAAKFLYPIEIMQVETPNGAFQRLYLGPFKTRKKAEEVLDETRIQGYDDAWMYRGPVEAGTDVEFGQAVEPVFTIDGLLSDDAAVPGQASPGAPGAPARSESNREAPQPVEVPEMETEAPPGYGLHRLRRDAMARPPPNNQTPTLAAGPLAVEIKTGDPILLPRYASNELNIDIDGRLSESAWQKVPFHQEFRVIEPDTLASTPHATRARLLYTEKGIYVGIDMDQPKETLISRLSSRDRRDVGRDSISFTLDTSGEGRYGFWFTVNLGDSIGDGTVLPERQFSRDWDGAWYGASAVTDHGWSAEFYVPWGQVSMPKMEGQRNMGLYMSRKVAYLDQRWAWPPLAGTQPKFMSALQPLVMEDVNLKQQYAFFPYTSVTMDEIDNSQRTKVGADVFWRPSTNFQVTATLNPDFGSVESDDVIVNLTAFETFFPEKRLFFLEGQEIFVTSPRSDQSRNQRGLLTLLNTRRIGGSPRDPDLGDEFDFPGEELGQPSELLGALKATGQLGRVRYGVMSAFEEDTAIRGTENGNPIIFNQTGRNFGVARFLFEDTVKGDYRSVGWMTTAVMHPDGNAVVHGLDGHYLSTTGAWKWDGQLMLSDIEDKQVGKGGFFDLEYTPKQGITHALAVDYFDPHLDLNDLGFLRRNDVYGGRYRFSWRKSGYKKIRDSDTSFFAVFQQNTEGQGVGYGLFFNEEITLNNLSKVFMESSFFPKRFDDINSEDNGTFRIEERSNFNLGFVSDPSRRLGWSLEGQYLEEDLDGDTFGGILGLTWRPLDRLSMRLETRYQKRDGWLLHQDNRDFTTFASEEWRPRLDVDFFLTAKQQFKLSLQWVGIKAFEQKFYQVPAQPDDLIRVDKAPAAASDSFAISSVNFQARYRWEIAPLSDLFVVYTRVSDPSISVRNSFDNLFTDAFDEPIGNQLVVKLRYRLGT